MTPAVMATTIQTRAMLAKLSISAWTARKFDRAATNQVNTANNAERDAGWYNKNLLGGKNTSLAEVTKAASAARTVHEKFALPWTDEGYRLLPTANFFEYGEAMRAARAEYERAVEKFVNEFTDLQEQAKVKLGTLYNELDYPRASVIRERFKFDLGFMPMPDAGDFRLALPADEVADLERSITMRVETAVKAAQTDAWRRLYEVVERVHARVSDPQIDEDSPTGEAKRRGIRDALATTGVETTELLENLNVMDDENFEKIRGVVLTAVNKLNPSTLRENSAARVTVAKETMAIMDAMSAFYSPTGTST